jgi:hypothetical protein
MPAEDQLQEVQQATPEVQEETQQASQESDDEAEAQLQAELAPRDINGDVDEGNIVTGPRRRLAKRDDAYAYATTIEEEPLAFLYTFAAALYAKKPLRRHRDDLPNPPKH